MVSFKMFIVCTSLVLFSFNLFAWLDPEKTPEMLNAIGAFTALALAIVAALSTITDRMKPLFVKILELFNIFKRKK